MPTTKATLERALKREKQLRQKCQETIRAHTRSQRELGRAMMAAERELERVARAPRKTRAKSKGRKR